MTGPRYDGRCRRSFGLHDGSQGSHGSWPRANAIKDYAGGRNRSNNARTFTRDIITPLYHCIRRDTKSRDKGKG